MWVTRSILVSERTWRFARNPAPTLTPDCNSAGSCRLVDTGCEGLDWPTECDVPLPPHTLPRTHVTTSGMAERSIRFALLWGSYRAQPITTVGTSHRAGTAALHDSSRPPG